MPRRCVARTLGIAAGGLLGFAVVPAAVAFADDYTIGSATDTETVTGVYGTGFDGADTAPPAVAGSVQGDGGIDYTDTTTGDTGEVTGDESTVTDGFGDTNTEVLVTSDSVTTESTTVTGTDAPPVGSVFDTYTFGDADYENIYSAIPTGDGDYTISDTLVTPYGDVTIPVTFDAADVSVADASGVTIGNDDTIDPVGSQTITAINGIPPLTMALQGTQTFDVDDASGTQVGTFDAVDTTTADAASTYTEAVLVTSDNGATDVGTAAGDVPGVGSIFNTIVLGDIENVYSDIVGTDGTDTITDTLDTPFGDFTIPVTLDAAEAEETAAVDLPDGDDLDPTGALDITGINGLPPADVGVQGEQVFDYTNADGTTGSFDADVTNTLDQFVDSTETILVTSDTDPDAQAGSVFETVTWGDGFENIYSDVVSTTGTDTISDTLVTPWGDITLPTTLDAAAGLATDAFQILGSI